MDVHVTREKKVWACCTAMLLGLAIWPVWSSRFLPLLDEPNHLSAIYIWHELSRATSPLHAFYELHIVPVSYLLHYGLARALAYVAGVEGAHKLALTLYVLAIPGAALWWCKLTGRSVWLALAVMPVAFSAGWSHGYHAFNMGIAVMLLGLAAQRALLVTPTVRSFAVAILLATACYFGHPFPLALLYVGTLVLWGVQRGGAKAMVLSALSLVPSFGFFRWQSRATSAGITDVQRILGKKFPVVSPEVWWARLLDLAEHAANPLASDVDTRVLWAALGVASVLGVLALRTARLNADTLTPYALAGAFLLPYFVLPEHFNEPVYMWIARGRIAPVIAFFLLIAPPIKPTSRLRFAYAALAAVVAIVPVQTALAYRAHGTFMAAFVRVLDACPKNAQVLTLAMGTSDALFPGYNVPVLRELPSLVQVVRGGYSPYWFPRPIPFPFAVTRKLPAPSGRRNTQYRRFLDPKVYPCVLTYALGKHTIGPQYTEKASDGPFSVFVANEAWQSPK